MSGRYMGWRLGFSAVMRPLHRPMRSDGWDSALGLDILNNTLKGEINYERTPVTAWTARMRNM